MVNLLYRPCHAKKNAFEHAQNAQIQRILRMRKVSSGPWLSVHSVVSDDSISGQWRPWWDCADAQAGLGFRCPHMPEDTFSHGVDHIHSYDLVRANSRIHFYFLFIYFFQPLSIYFTSEATCFDFANKSYIYSLTGNWKHFKMYKMQIATLLLELYFIKA